MKKRIGIMAGVLAGLAGLVTGVYATYKMNQKYQDYRHLKDEIDSIPYEFDKKKTLL